MSEPRKFKQEEVEEVSRYAAGVIAGLIGATGVNFSHTYLAEAFDIAELLLAERKRRTDPKAPSRVI